MEQKKNWAFGGGKGGVGKSFVAGNLGILLAQNGNTVTPNTESNGSFNFNPMIADSTQRINAKIYMFSSFHF